MRGKVEQILFLLARGRQTLEVVGVYDDVTGRAGHDAFTSALQRLARSPGNVEQPLPGFRFHFLVETAVSPEKPHQGHASSFSWRMAWAAMRLQAPTNSCWVVYRPKPMRIDERACL